MDQQPQKRDNSGYLFANKDKRTDKQPDYRGKVTVNGKEWLLSGWKRIKDGEEMISVSVTDPASLPPREGAAAPRQGAASTPFSRPAAAPAAGAPAAAPKSFQPKGGKAADGPGFDDLEDLDSLFSGLGDDK